MREPGPDHPIAIAPTGRRVRVRLGGEVIADTTRALSLKEASYPVVQYIPREDVRMELMHASATATRCPYKGDASYLTAQAGHRLSEDAAWSYEHPYPAVAAIAGHLAFYPDRVDSIEVGED